MSQNKRLTKEEIQEDKFINLVLQSYAFLKDNLRTIIITVAVVVVGMIVYLSYNQMQQNKYVEASANFNDAAETYKEAETNFFDVSSPSEPEEDTDDKETEEKTSFQDAEEKLQIVFDKYTNTTFAEKARFNYAKSLYFQGKYQEARTQFEKVIETKSPNNQIYALYAHKAIGNCYEQEGDYAKAITAYDAKAFPDTPNLSPEIRKYVVSNAKFNQALCQEKLNTIADAKITYKEIIGEFKDTVNHGIEEKSIELINQAKEVIQTIEDPLGLRKAEGLESEERYFDALIAYTDAIRAYKEKKDSEGDSLSDILKATEDIKTSHNEISGDGESKNTVDLDIEQKSIKLIKQAKEVILTIEDPLGLRKAEGLESEEHYFEALIAYTDAIRAFKVKKDIEGGFLPEQRKRIRNYEDISTEVIDNVLSARKSEELGLQSSALSSYNSVVDFEKIGLSRDLYELALLNYARLSISDTEGLNER